MKQKDSNKSITFGAMDGFDTVISADGSGFLVALLRDKLYTDKRKVALFETLANAVDANRWVNAKKNVEVILTRKNLVIRDYGPGCDRDKMQNVYFAYCNSTKSSDNVNIGGFGIGSKSPSAYSDAYFVISRNGGMATMYMSVIDGRTNKVSVMYSIPLEDPEDTGLTVIIPISEDRDVDSEMSIFNELIMDGLVFRMASQGYDCIDYYNASSLDEDIDGWDALTEDERKKYLFSVDERDDEGNVYKKWRSVAAMREITEKCPYFAKLRGATGCPDEHIKLHDDAEESKYTYGDLAAAYELIEAKLKTMKGPAGTRDVSALTDSDIHEEILRIGRKYRLDYIPKVGFVFDYAVESPFYRGCSMGAYMVLACDGDMTYGIPGELPGIYSSKGFVDKDYPDGNSWNSMFTTLLAEFGRDELTIQPNRETVAADDALDAWLSDRCSSVDRYYTMKCFVLSRARNLGTNCLLYDCAKKAENYLDGEYVPLSNWLLRDVRSSVKDDNTSVCKAYSQSTDMTKYIDKAYSYRTARYNENGRHAIGELKADSARVTTFKAEYNKAIVVLNDVGADVDTGIGLIPEDFTALTCAAADPKALNDFIVSSKSNAEYDAEGNGNIIMLVDSGKYDAFKKATAKFFREKGVGGFLEGVDLFRFSEIQKVRQTGDYYEKCVNVRMKEVEEVAYSYIERKRAVAEASSGSADSVDVKAVDAVEKPKAKPRKKREATGSSTLSKAKPLCLLKYEGVRSVNGVPVSVEEFNETRTKEEGSFRKGAVDWSGFSDTVMVPTKRRFKGTDVMSTVLLRSSGDDSDSVCCGNILRTLLGVKYIVRVLPSEMEGLAKDNGWDMWNKVDYIGRLQNVIDTFKLTSIPSRLYGLLTSAGLSWDSDKCSRIKTVSVNRNGIGVSPTVDLGGKYGLVPVTRIMTCIMYVLRCIDCDPCYNTALAERERGARPTLGGTVIQKLDEMATSCIAALSSVSEKSKKDVMACVNSHCTVTDPCIASVFGTSEKCTVSDAVLKRGYGVFVKAMPFFNRPLNLSDALGVKKALTADVE
ncbi:MAG: hypothetical protein MJZ17_05875 [Bacteroidales bacterium]|nr:hypothetical protein [Bacteroidales bacterium]